MMMISQRMMNNMYTIEEYDKFKQKMLKYIMYKKRSETEIRQKFADSDENMLEDAIEYFKELNYINDNIYVERAIKEFMAINTLSIKEISYILYNKGIDRKTVDNYIYTHREELLDYEIECATKLVNKKMTTEDDEEKVREFLFKKGYMSETINIAFDEYNG